MNLCLGAGAIRSTRPQTNWTRRIANFGWFGPEHHRLPQEQGSRKEKPVLRNDVPNDPPKRTPQDSIAQDGVLGVNPKLVTVTGEFSWQ